MKEALKIGALVVCLSLAGCGWDMNAKSWAKAVELCAPFGGVVAADQTWMGGYDYSVEAKCANGQTVERYYTGVELVFKAKDGA